MTEPDKHDETAPNPEDLDVEEMIPSDQTPDAPDSDGPESPTESLQQERGDLLNRLQRLGADYQNYQKRVQRDIQQAREYANEELIKSLLPVLDDMERALSHARENHGEDDPLFRGMQLVHDNMLATLGKFGVERIDAAGETFDPDRHAAMMQQPTDEHEPMTILEEVQRGYQLKGRTIRPAGVVVAREPGEQ